MKSKSQHLYHLTAVLLFGLFVVALSVLITQPAGAIQIEQNPVVAGVYQGVSTAVQFDISPPLRSIPAPDIKWDGFEDPDPSDELEKAGAFGPQDQDPLVQSFSGPNLIPSPVVSFNGPNNIFGGQPPDPVGDVGPDHYVAMTNLYFAVYDKSGNLLLGPLPNNTLWAGFGGACQNENAGDPIVVYDQLADRWILTQFTSAGPTYYNCVALSTTGDPTDTYYRYAFSTGTNFPDYPKYGVWPDAYYISTREFAGGNFAGVGAYALNRAEMLSGDPTPQVVSFLAPPGGTPYNVGAGLLPTDLDGSNLPPPGSPNYFVGSMDNGGPYGAPQDALTLWKFHVDWAIPGNSTFTLANTIPVDAFDSIFPCSPGSRDCIPQPGTGNKIDILSYRQRPMWRLAYRNFGTHESLVTNQSVEAATNMAGIRWYEIRDPNNSPAIYQQSTYAPGVSDGIHRWMGSIAMDQDGNMALGYSASNATTTFPSVWYTGRLVTDPLGTMPQGEGSFVNGTGSQTSGQRWGDYTSMNIDPVDDCTFWYINEYHISNGTNWQTRIGAFRFPACGGPKGYIEGTVQDEVTSDPIEGILVTAETITGTFSAQTDATGYYTMSVVAGIYNVTAQPLLPTYPISATVSGVTVVVSDTAVADFSLSPIPGSPNLISPSDNSSDTDLEVTFVWEDSGTGTEPTGYIFTLDGTAVMTFTSPVTTTTLTLTTGSHTWSVIAFNAIGNSLPSATWTVTTPEAPGSPNLISPPDNSTDDDLEVTFVWEDSGTSTEPTGYIFTLDGTAVMTYTSPVTTTTTTLTSGSHTWSVRAFNEFGTSDASETWTVIVPELPGSPDLISPPDNSTDDDLEVTFVWEDSGTGTEPTGYVFTLDGTAVMTYTSPVTTTTMTLTSGIHTWSVTAFNLVGNSLSSSTWAVIVPEAPSSPTLVSPADNATNDDEVVTFVWEDSGLGGEPTGYIFILDGTAVMTFTSPITTTTLTLTVGSHTWSVVAYNGVGASAASQVWTINVPQTQFFVYLPVVIKP